MKLKAQIQFDNFLSTVLMDEKGGVTYNDLIRDIFGWSSRVPTMLINVFPRDGKLFFIQRGHETHSVDITQSKHTVPVITREIVRTSYGSSVESTTTINEYDITANIFTPDTIVGSEEGGGEEEKWVTLQDKSSGENWTATTTYYYSKGNDMSPAGGKIPAGLLVKVETEKSYSYGSEEADSFTQIMHTYDSDGTRIGTETYVHYSGGTNPTTDTRNINFLRYITLPNGEKYLASESTERYEEGETGYPDKLVDSTITNHSPTRLGQTHVTTITDDGIAGGVTGQNTGDDRVTPYSQKKVQNTAAALANANGTSGDVDTLTHEAGHAFQAFCTFKNVTIPDLSFPTMESAEINSMSMEFFAHPWSHLFFKEEAEKYRYFHIADSLKFLPYGCLIDHFQHEVYNHPEMTPDERKACFRRLEKIYKPDIDYEGFDLLERGGFFFRQGHVFQVPFYYIDYTLAQVCALQFFVRMLNKDEDAWKDYVRICGLGGTKTFTQIVREAHLKVPFEEGCLKEVSAKMKEELGKIDDSKF